MKKSHFKIFTSLSLIVLSLGLTSCHRKSNTLKIGFILDSMKEERYTYDRRFFEEKAHSLGAEVVFASADFDATRQMNLVEDMLSSGVKAIVIQPVDSKAAAAMVETARKEKVPVVAYDRIIYGAPISAYVTQDSFYVGVLQAEAAVKATHEKGNYLILSGAEGHSVAKAITDGVLSVLKKYPQIKIVGQMNHAGWSTELALRTTENTLTRLNDHLDAILANSSALALGAVQAVDEQKLSGKVFIAGSDAELAAIKNILKGKQQFEVLKDIKPLADAAAETAVELATNKPIHSDLTMDNQSGTPIPVINTPVYAITKDNIEDRIVKTGFLSRDAVYGHN